MPRDARVIVLSIPEVIHALRIALEVASLVLTMRALIPLPMHAVTETVWQESGQVVT